MTMSGVQISNKQIGEAYTPTLLNDDWKQGVPLLSERGQRGEKGFEEAKKACCNSSRPTTSQTQLDSPPEIVQVAETEMCVDSYL